MNKNNNKIINHVFVFTLILLLSTFFIVFVRNYTANILAKDMVHYSLIRGIFNLAVILIICIPIILKLDLKESIGLNIGKGFYKGFGMLSILIFVGLCYSGIIYIGYKDDLVKFQGIGMFLSFFFMMLTVGVMEEFGVRGILLQIYIQKWGKTKKGVIWAAFLSSFVFGLQHIFSLLFQFFRTSKMSSEAVWQTFFQVIFSSVIGFLFAIVVIYKKNIWIVSVIHGVYDFLLGLEYIYIPQPRVYTVSLNTAFPRIFGENKIVNRGNAEMIFFSAACIIEVIWIIILCIKKTEKTEDV